MKRIIPFVFLVLCIMPLAGCGGGGAKTNVQQTTTTLGQELEDLDAAYKKGLLSEKEYNKARKDLIEKRTD